MQKLIDFWKGYRQCTLTIDDIMPDIIKEFYIMHNFNIPYTELVKKFPIKVKSESKDLKEINKGIYKDKLEFLDNIATYKIAKSKLLETKYGYILNECIEKVFSRIHKEFEKNEISLPEMLMHKNITDHWWEPLRNYNVYFNQILSKSIIIEGTEKYECKQGIWNRTIYSSEKSYKHIIGYILKTMECYIRDYLGYRKLKYLEKSEILKDIDEYYCSVKKRNIVQKIYKMDLEQIIQTETIRYLENAKIPKMTCNKKKQENEYFEKEEKIEVVFNQEEFQKIREKSEEIQKALIIEEDTQMPNNEILKKYQAIAEPKEIVEQNITKNTQDNVFRQFAYDLNTKEKEIINTILKKQDVQSKITQIAQRENEMLEVMISNINDKALETIGDTIIESDMTSIYEDYENELKQVL